MYTNVKELFEQVGTSNDKLLEGVTAFYREEETPGDYRIGDYNATKERDLPDTSLWKIGYQNGSGILTALCVKDPDAAGNDDVYEILERSIDICKKAIGPDNPANNKLTALRLRATEKAPYLKLPGMYQLALLMASMLRTARDSATITLYADTLYQSVAPSISSDPDVGEGDYE